MQIEQKILLTFNKYFYDFIEDLQTINPSFKSYVAETFKVRQMKTEKNLSLLKQSMNPEIYKSMTSTTDAIKLFAEPHVGEMKIVPNMTLKNLIEGVDVSHFMTILSYVYVLILLVTIYDYQNDEKGIEPTERLEIVEELFNNSMDIVLGIEKNEDYTKSLSNIYDPNILGILIAMGSLKKEINTKSHTHEEPSSIPSSDESLDPFMEKMRNMLQGSKIGQFTNEIMSDLTTEMKDEMSDVSNIEDFMKSGKVGNVINKTVQYFDKKNKSGEFTQEDIMKECANLMSVFGNTASSSASGQTSGSSHSSQTSPSSQAPAFNMNDLQNIMKLFSSEDKFKLDPTKVQNEETKNRLRRKLEAKKSKET